MDEDQLRTAREQQKRTGGDLGQTLVELGYVSEELLLRAQSNQLGIPLVNPAQLALLGRESGFRIEAAAATAGSIEKAIKAAFSSEPAAEGAHPVLEPEPDHDLDGLRERVALLEKVLGGPQFAALLARLERLEQIAERDHHALNVLGSS